MPRPTGERLPRNAIKEAHALYESSGLSIEKIAEKYGCAAITLSRRFKALGLPIRARGHHHKRGRTVEPEIKDTPSGWTAKVIGGVHDGLPFAAADPGDGTGTYTLCCKDKLGEGMVQTYGVGRIFPDDLTFQVVLKETLRRAE